MKTGSVTMINWILVISIHHKDRGRRTFRVRATRLLLLLSIRLEGTFFHHMGAHIIYFFGLIDVMLPYTNCMVRSRDDMSRLSSLGKNAHLKNMTLTAGD